MDPHSVGQKGLTIMEIIVAMAIIGILSAISVPAVINYLPEYRLEIAAKGLYANLQRTKQEAVRMNGECAIYFNELSDQYFLIAAGSDGICNGPPLGVPPVPQQDDEMISSVTLSNYGSGVRFGSGLAKKNASGKTISSALTISYVNDRIRFDSKGMAREMGYVYLTNMNGTAFVVGTPSLAGAVVQKKWFSNSWN